MLSRKPKERERLLNRSWTQSQSLGCDARHFSRHVAKSVRAYEGDVTRGIVETLGMTPIMPPKVNRKVERDYDSKLYKLRKEVERLFRRLKGYQRIYTWLEKLDAMFLSALYFVVVVEMIYDLA